MIGVHFELLGQLAQLRGHLRELVWSVQPEFRN
jgi:hypothetical protein